MTRLLIAAIAAASLAAPFSPKQKNAQVAITEAVLRAHVRFLASDLLEGRGPGTRGDALARAYIAAELEALGLEPASPGGGFFQAVPLVGISSDVPEAVTFAAGERRLELQRGAEFIASSGLQAPEARIQDAEVVFLGYGITAPEYGWDDFKGLDVRGKVLLVMNNDPEDDPALFEGKRRTYYGRWTYKYEEAARRGAAGAIIIHTTPSAAYPWSVVRTSFSGTVYELPDEGEPRLRVKAWVTEDAARRMVGLGGQDLDALRAAAQRRDFRPVPLGVGVSLRLGARLEHSESANVLARLPGRDHVLGREAVLFTAHHDHFGIKEGAAPGKDVIYNGALDNASGCAAVLGIARAFAALPERPRRSILFAFVAAEEHNLLGSSWLARFPPVPAGRIAADLNFDTVRFFGRTRDVVMGAFGKSTLDEAIQAAARSQGRVVRGDPFPEHGSFYRSDHFSLARAGVPATSISSGVDVVGKPEGWGRARVDEWISTHYHQPSDELGDDWDFSGMVEDARLGFLAGLYLAQVREMPRWRPGDEFEAARRRALEAVEESGNTR